LRGALPGGLGLAFAAHARPGARISPLRSERPIDDDQRACARLGYVGKRSVLQRHTRAAHSAMNAAQVGTGTDERIRQERPTSTGFCIGDVAQLGGWRVGDLARVLLIDRTDSEQPRADLL
jgi:hypothetical protein